MHLSIYQLAKYGLLVLTLHSMACLTSLSAQSLWSDILPISSERAADLGLEIGPNQQAMTARLDLERVAEALSEAKPRLTLPDPGGNQARYDLRPTSCVDPSVAEHYSIRTFHGRKSDDAHSQVACDLSPEGFSAYIIGGEGSYTIERIIGAEDYLIVHTSNYPTRRVGSFSESPDVLPSGLSSLRSSIPDAKRTYRLALAAAGEFSQQFGGSPVNTGAVLNALACGVNRVNMIYLRDLGTEFILVSTPDVIFPDPLTDFFDTTNPTSLIFDSSGVLENFLGTQNYDLGHTVLWAPLGSQATYGNVCTDGTKAEAYSSSDVSTTQLWIDQVCHELGHQLGALNSYSARGCGDADRGSVYEPGEGSSIMGIAGECGPPFQYATTADPYFHMASIVQINDFFTQNTNPNQSNCAVLDPTGNDEDPIVSIGPDIVIPISTPFILAGEAVDVDTLLTYDWEQFDGNGTGSTGPPDCALDDVLFRFRGPSLENYRSFPLHAEVLNANNTGALWEQLPCVPRSMTFSMAVRDNNAAWGRVAHDTLEVTVVNSGPFGVTQPNGGEVLPGGMPNNITWAINGTDTHCPLVDILISLDGGRSYTVLVDATANDGTESVILPNANTLDARILISCDVPGGYGSGSTFYDVSDGSFEIMESAVVDADGDSYDASVDCDDNDPAVNPGATETCNGIDDNCDNLIDDADPNVTGQGTFYIDADGDGYGDPASLVMACVMPAGHVLVGMDCDDTDPAVNPAAPEICNGIDDDCDGLVDTADSDLINASVWYIDVDGDNYGDPLTSLVSCTQPMGYVSDNNDCDDTDPAVNPGALEVCNGIDDNCNGFIDSNDPTLAGGNTWHLDNDGDGYGNPMSTVEACTQPPGYVANGDDCNDGNVSINPGAQEICNGIDDDCDGLTDGADPDVVAIATWYADNDGDGFGNPLIPINSCTQPLGFVDNALDCDDNFTSINPNAIELCNGVDDDCDGLIDAADPDLSGTALWYADLDGDGFGDANNSQASCTQPAGFVANDLDCDDNAFAINPGATEICNNIDDDCDGFIDDEDPSLQGSQIWYADADQDGFGDPTNFIESCNLLIGFVANNTDCDDTDPNISPANLEVCNGIDDDCDGLIDDEDSSLSSGTIWYQDLDMDGFGNNDVSLISCVQPAGFVINNSDCNDGDPNVSTASVEVCNGLDDDCDGLIDEQDPDLQGGSTWFQDFDGDGFGSATQTIISCEPPIGFVPNDLDCDDTVASINPTAQEICNGIDDDCDGLIDDEDSSLSGASTWYADFDNDGFGVSSSVIISCFQPAGFVPNNLDCNDNNALINPAAGEICDNNIDDDCDGLTDTDDPDVASGTSTWYQDLDGDGFGNPSSVLNGCNQPVGFVGNNLDCDDNNASINPSSMEICDNNIDDDCDGLVDTADPDLAGLVMTWYFDADGDGYGSDLSLVSCNQPTGYVPNNLDCNDADVSVSPDGVEICGNNLDDDCDGLVDQNDPDVILLTWYLDQDGDGYGDINMQMVDCLQPAGYVSNAADCNDADNTINPDGIELCDNGIDEDCDGLVDGADPDVSGVMFWYEDADGDGFGNPQEFSQSCNAPPGFVMNNEDCDDNNPQVNPAALELCDNGLDDDCDGLVDTADPDVASEEIWYLDSDGDGYGDATMSIQTCNPGPNYVQNNTDCDDTNGAISPGGIEVCNGRDDDCDGFVDIDDPDLSGVGIWFADLDEDGYGDPDNFIFECTQLPGFLPNNEDCNDLDPSINPDAVEECNGIDDNCDGLVDDQDPSVSFSTWYLDADGDGFGDPDSSLDECFQPLGFIDNDLDCDDEDADINPLAQEIPDNDIDENCDGALTSVTTLSEAGYSFYPNPAVTDLYVTGTGLVELRLYNIDGKLVYHNERITLPTRLDVTGQRAGTYLLMINDLNENRQAIDKVILLE